jgi:hypothetical protein
MSDETIEVILYRTGRVDRLVALGLGLLLAACLPLLWWVSGPFLWPWGGGALFLAGLGAISALAWWWKALGTVCWVPGTESLEFRRGRRVRNLDLSALTRVEVRPSSVVTRLEAGGKVFRISHRLVRAEDLLDRLRRRRPDLFDVPGPQETFRVSSVGLVMTVFLALVTAGTGVLLADWKSAVGWVFFGGAGLTLGRALFFIPRAFVVGRGFLTEVFWLRRRTWRVPSSHQESLYAAGGAAFFRLRFDFGPRQVVLDEGSLLDPLRPRAGWVVQQLDSTSV